MTIIYDEGGSQIGRVVTKPTPAQIEAVQKVFDKGGDTHPQTFIDLLRDEGFALSAAAEVDRGAQTGKALTGNLNEVSLGENSESVLHRHTIERCAQVAVDALNQGRDPIAAIRALKDKP